MKFSEITKEIDSTLKRKFPEIELVYDQGTLYPRIIYVHVGNADMEEVIETINHAGIFNLAEPNGWRYRALRLLPHGIHK